MDLPAMMNQFKVLTESAKDEDTLKLFMMSVKYQIQNYFSSSDDNEIVKCDKACNKDKVDILSKIAADLRSQVPLEAQLKSEKIVFPKTGKVKFTLSFQEINALISLFRTQTVIHEQQYMLMRSSMMTHWSMSCATKESCPRVTAWRAGQETRNPSVKQLVLNQRLSRFITSWILAFISHSASQENLAYVFKTLLPDLKGKHVLDVGSRLGAVLFAAALYSEASQITGVEINKEWASISSSVVQKYKMQVHS